MYFLIQLEIDQENRENFFEHFFEYFRPINRKISKQSNFLKEYLILFEANYNLNELKSNIFDFSIFYKIIHYSIIDDCSFKILMKTSDFHFISKQHLQLDKEKLEFSDDRYWTKS